MQISKPLLIIWAALICAGPQLVCAADTDAQIKAREALRKKMDELQPGSGQATAPAPAVVPQTPAPAKPPTAVAKPAPAPAVIPPPAAPEVVTAPPVDSEATARAREAVRKKMEQLHTEPVPQTKAPAPEPAVVNPTQPAPVAPPPVVRTAPPPQPVVHQPEVPTPAPTPTHTVTQPHTPAPTSSDRQTAEQAAQNQAKTKPTASKAPPKTKPGPPAPFQPIEGPPLNISAEKQQRLAELLRRYQADEVTPAQYHQERARILAQP